MGISGLRAKPSGEICNFTTRSGAAFSARARGLPHCDALPPTRPILAKIPQEGSIIEAVDLILWVAVTNDNHATISCPPKSLQLFPFLYREEQCPWDPAETRVPRGISQALRTLSRLAPARPLRLMMSAANWRHRRASSGRRHWQNSRKDVKFQPFHNFLICVLFRRRPNKATTDLPCRCVERDRTPNTVCNNPEAHLASRSQRRMKKRPRGP
jgi:hypothetical protein